MCLPIIFLGGLIVYARSILLVSTRMWLSTIFSGAFFVRGDSPAVLSPKVVIVDFVRKHISVMCLCT